MARRPVLKNIAILTGAGLFERFLGALYRVILARAAGPVALGLIQFCLPILRLAMILSTLGLPQALARAVAEALARGKGEEARAALGWSLRITATIAGVIALLLVATAPLGRWIFPDPRVAPLLRWLAPILFCDSLAIILQANFQGQNRMWPLALAGLLGQGSKLTISLVLIRWASAKGVTAIAGAALAGMVVSEVVSCFFLAGMTGKPKMTGAIPDRRALLLSSLPLMGDALVFAIAGTMDVLVVPRRLIQAGMAPSQITSLMGQVWGMALPTLFMPMVAIWPIAAVTLPVMTAAVAKGDFRELRRRISLTYMAVCTVAFTATAVFLLIPRSLVTVLYACPSAAPYLQMLAWAVPPIYLASIGGTFLVGLDQTPLLFRQSVVCVMLRTFLLYVLTGMPRLGIAGAVIGIAVGNAALALANGWGVWRYLNRELTPSIPSSVREA